MPDNIRAAELPSPIFRHRSHSLELRRAEGAGFADLIALSKVLFLRGDVLGRIADHDRAELIATEAMALSPDTAHVLYIRARFRGPFPSVRRSERSSRSSARRRLSTARD